MSFLQELALTVAAPIADAVCGSIRDYLYQRRENAQAESLVEDNPKNKQQS